MATFNDDSKKRLSFSGYIKNSLLDNIYFDSFIIYESIINNNLNLIFQDQKYSIICYNIETNQKIIEIKFEENNCTYEVSSFAHIRNLQNKLDLIIVGFSCLNVVQVWDSEKWECILNLKNIYKGGRLGYVNFLRNENEILLVTCQNHYSEIKGINVFNLNGQKIKELKDSNKEKVYYFVTFFHKDNNFIVAGCDLKVISYDFNNNKINKIFHDLGEYYNGSHVYIRVIENQNNIKIIESCYDGKIRIWDFNSGELIQKINVSNEALFGFSLFKDEYLIIGGDGKILLLNLKKNNECSEFEIGNNPIVTINGINQTPSKILFAFQMLHVPIIQISSINL